MTCPSRAGVSQHLQDTGTGLGAQRWPNVTQHVGLLLGVGRTRSLHPATRGLPSVGVFEQESPAQCCPRQLSWGVLYWKCKYKVRKGEMGHIQNVEHPPPPQDCLYLRSSEPPAAPGFPITPSIMSFHVASSTDREECLAR